MSVKQTRWRNKDFRIKSGTFLFSLLFGTFYAHAQTTTPLSESITKFLTDSVSAFAKSINSDEYEIKMHPINAQNTCDGPVNFSLSNPDRPMGRVAITAECNGSKHWQIRAYANVNIYVTVITAKKNIERDQVLEAKQLTTKKIALNSRRLDYFTNTDQLVNSTTKRKVKAGAIFTERMVEAPLLVNKNDIISIEAKGATFSASMSGIALEDGRKGDLIKVRNLSSQKILNGRVIAPQVIAITF